MGASVSVRIEHRTAKATGGQRAHDLRLGDYAPDYVDRTRSADNSVLIEPARSADLRLECENRRSVRATQRAMRSNAAVSTCGIITFSHEAQPIVEALCREEQDALFQRIAQRIADRLDTTLTGLVVHRDESALHAHFQMPAVARGSGKPLSKIVNRAVAKELQDIAGDCTKHLGITRGESKELRLARGDDLSKVVHRSVKQLHQDLPKELEALETQIEAQQKALRLAEARRRIREKSALIRENKAREKIEALETQKQAMERDKEAMQAEMDKTTVELAAQREKAEKNRRLIETQEKKLAEQRVSEQQAAKRIEAYERRLEAAKAAVEKLETRKAEQEAEIEALEAQKTRLEANLQIKRNVAQADIARAVEAVLDGMRYLGVIDAMQQQEIMDTASPHDLVRAAILFRDEAGSIARAIEAEKAKAIQRTKEQAKEQGRVVARSQKQQRGSGIGD